MTKYFYDHDRDENIKRWFKEENGFFPIDRPSDIDRLLKDDDLIFIHTNDPSWWVKKATKSSEAEFVFMSRDPSGIKRGDDWPDNIHICRYPAHELQKYDQVRRFFEELSNKKTLWNLLVPEMKSHIIALCILCQGYLAANKHFLKDAKDQIMFNLPSGVKISEEKDFTRAQNWWKPVMGDDFTASKLNGQMESFAKEKNAAIRNLLADIIKIDKVLKKEEMEKFTEAVYHGYRQLKDSILS
jgi:hypothetical protein